MDATTSYTNTSDVPASNRYILDATTSYTNTSDVPASNRYTLDFTRSYTNTSDVPASNKYTLDATTINIISLNCQSLKNKVFNILNYLEEKGIGIAALQETWLSKADRSITSEIHEMGFKVLNQFRDARSGGGLAILYRPHLKLQRFNLNTDKSFATFESLCTRLKSNGKVINIINLYRPPYSAKNPKTIKMFLDEFIILLSLLVECKGLVIILGDININLLVNNTYSSDFKQILDSFDLTQLITTSTHIKGGLLDIIIISRVHRNALLSASVCEDFKTDHFPITAILENESVYIKKTVKYVREYHKCDVSLWNMDIANSCLNDPSEYMHASADESVAMYNKTLSNLLNKHCPLVRKIYTTNRQKSPWYNSELQKLKQKRRKYERKFKKRPTEENKNLLNQMRNKYNNKLKYTRSKFYKLKLNDSYSQPKAYFRILGKITGSVQEQKLPTYNTPQVVADDLSKFYVDKITKIRNNLDKHTISINSKSLDENANRLRVYQKITTIEIEKILVVMKKKTCQLDPAPTSLVSHSFKTLKSFFTHVINSVIEEAHFPDLLKHAQVTPKVKDNNKSNDDLANLRPISRLPFLAKLIEKVLHLQTEDFINTNQLHAKFQSAYRACLHSWT